MGRLVDFFNPALSRQVWLLQAGVLVNFFGNGLVAPFLVIYLHFGRGIPLGLAGSAVALGGLTAVTSGLVAGVLADRVGPRNTLAAAMVANAAAYLAYTQVTAPWQAFGVGLLVGIGTGAYGPSSQLLLSSMVPADNRQAALAQNRVTSVVGLGLGGTVGGLIAMGGLQGYLRLLELDAITFLAFAAIALLLPSGRASSRTRPAAGYRAVLRDRPFRWLTATNLAMVSAGIAPMLVLLPAFAKGQAHVGEAAIGGIYAASTLTVVVAQLPLARLTRRHNRMRVLRLGALGWAACWVVILAAGAEFSGLPAAAIIGAAAVGYALGECLYSSIVLPTATALAPDHLRGRYLGVVGFSWQGGFLIGPALGGVVLGARPLALPALCAVGCLVAAGLTSAVDRSLAPGLRTIPVPVAAS